MSYRAEILRRTAETKRYLGRRPNRGSSLRVPTAEALALDLGLAISGALLKPGETRTLDEIGAFCGCDRRTIFMIQQRAIQKLRRRFSLMRDPLLKELMDEYFFRREPAHTKEASISCPMP